MSTPLEEAAVILDLEIAQLSAAEVGGPLWHVRQAKSLALSYVRRASQLGLESPTAVDALRRNFRKEVIRFEETSVDKAPPDEFTPVEAVRG